MNNQPREVSESIKNLYAMLLKYHWEVLDCYREFDGDVIIRLTPPAIDRFAVPFYIRLSPNY